MSVHIDNAELMSLLESSDSHTVNEVRDLIRDHLATGKEVWLVNTVVDSFVESNSTRCLELLAGLNEPHDKHLFDRMSEHWKSGNKIQILMIVGHLVRREPLWLHKLVGHQLMQMMLKTLKSESDPVTLLTGALSITALLPVVPTYAVHVWPDVCELFGRLATTSHSKAVTTVCALHMQVATNIMFNRLYGMYPCHFLTYLRTAYSRPEAAGLFNDVIKPLLCQVRVHPLLVTATKEKEVNQSRWKNKDVHDILVECGQLSLDLVDGNRGNFVVNAEQEQRRTSSVRKSVTDTTVSTTGQLTAQPGWTPSSECGLSTPPANTVSGDQKKPSPLVLSSAGVESKSGDSPSPLTPFIEQSTPKQLGPSFDFTKTPTANDESALDLSGRFTDGGLVQAQKMPPVCLKCDAGTQTVIEKDLSCIDIKIIGPSGGHIPTERSTSTDNASVGVDDSDASSSPTSGTGLDHMTSAAVAEFVKKVKRIRFNSITVAKEHQMHNTAPPPRMQRSHSASCPDLKCNTSSSSNDSDIFVLNDSPQLRRATPIGFASPVATFMSAQVSPMAIHMETVGTQTALYFNGCELVGDLAAESQQIPYELLATLTLPYAPFLQCYSCLRGQNGGASGPQGAKIWSPASFSRSHSPTDLLDRYLEQSVAVHSTAAQGKRSNSSPDVLLGEVRLLHTSLLFERHKGEVYARRNAKLVSQVANLMSVMDQNEAIRDQLRLQEAEMNKLKEMLQKEQQANRELRQSMEKQQSEASYQLKNSVSMFEESKTTMNQMEEMLKSSKSENASLERDLELARHSLFEKDKDLELLRQQANTAVQLQDQVTQLNVELLLMGELHEKYQQRLIETTNLHSTEFFNLRKSLEASRAECNDFSAELKHLKVAHEAVTAKLAYMEQQIKIKELLIEDQKQLLEQTKLMNHTERQTITEKLKGSVKQQSCLQQRIYELECELTVLRNSHPYQRVRSSATEQHTVVGTAT